MTIKQIEALGFPHIPSKIKPRLFYVYDRERVIPEYYNIDDIHKLIFDDGVEEGIKQGKLQQTNKFRESLGMKMLNES